MTACTGLVELFAAFDVAFDGGEGGLWGKIGKGGGQWSQGARICRNVFHRRSHEKLGTVVVLFPPLTGFELLELLKQIPFFHSINHRAPLHFPVAMAEFAGLESLWAYHDRTFLLF